MATLVLGAAGAALGGSIGGAFLGVSAATIGGFVGSTIGSAVDSWIISSLAPTQRIEGPRLDTLRITSATEGAVVARVFGRMRLGGQIIWATDFREEIKKTTQGGGKGGGRPKTETTEYLYYASFAVALCEGEITGIGRVWADGKLLDTSGITLRWYSGSETQTPDPVITSKMGADRAPAYRGTAYVMFDDMPLQDHGNRLPQLSFEVFRALAEDGGAETMVRSVAILPGAGEFSYATVAHRRGADGSEVAQNVHAIADRADFLVSIDNLQAAVPNLEAVTLIASWFGDDLRAGECEIRPRVEQDVHSSTPDNWRVNGLDWTNALVVTANADGLPVFGGTPSDSSIVQAIQELKARGLRVTFRPQLLMDIPASNALPDPYSNNAGTLGQGAFPLASRITCSPAAGFTGSADKSAAAASQISDFFGGAAIGDFNVVDEEVNWTGASGDWGFRRMVLHYANLCAAAGGVDAFLIGGQLPGLTTVRSGAAIYPAVTQLVDLAVDAAAVLGSGVAVSYAADWSEYSGHHPDDTSGDVYFHLDPLWSNAAVDFVGIDNFMPVSDWRDGSDHLDAVAGWESIYDRAYLKANMAGGEFFDWVYASTADRAAQERTAIADPSGKPWVYRSKDIRSWWSNRHYNRPGGAESGSPTGWTAEMKPIRFTALGCPAIDRGTNQPSAFQIGRSSDSAIPHWSRGYRDDAIQRSFLEASLEFWGDTANNPAGMVDLANSAVWAWDARPYPQFPDISTIWSDTGDWETGYWITGRLGSSSLPALVGELCRRAGLPLSRFDASALVGSCEGLVITALESPRGTISGLARHFGFDAIESEGLIRFVMRNRNASVALTHDDLVDTGSGDILELIRGQETELSQSLKWQVIRSDGDFDPAQVEARRITVTSQRANMESFPLAVSLQEAERRVQRALIEEWAAREKASFKLPPSRLALDPSDVVILAHDGRGMSFRLVSIADTGVRGVEAIRQDQQAYDSIPGLARASVPRVPVVFGTPVVALMDLPQLAEGIPAHRPYVAAHAQPWPGTMSALRSPTTDAFELVTTFGLRAQIGVVAAEFRPGPTSRFDHVNALLIDLYSGQIASVTDLALFAGANALAIETSAGVWEIVQAGTVELVSARRYRLSRLLRGQRGTEGAIGNPTPVGSRVVVLDATIFPLPIAESDVGIPYNWRVGPSARAVSDDSYRSAAFTAEGVGLRPFSVAHVQQPYLRPRSGDDLLIAWTRRSRSLAADTWAGIEVPLVEGGLSFEVDILDGVSVVRTLATTGLNVTYSGADQTVDFGVPLSAGDSLSIRVYQLSDLVGRGAPKSATLIL